MVTFEDVKKNEEVKVFIRRGDELLKAAGYTEHSYVHAGIVSATAARILKEIGRYTPREIELARIAGYLHDIGNMVNRNDHAQSGAILAYQLLKDMHMDVEEATLIASAVGNHDEGTGSAISPVSAAIILADKSDVRQSRVRRDFDRDFDIHDRVNSSVHKCEVLIDQTKNQICVDISIDTEVSSVMDFFEIFLGRMLMCKKSAEFFGMKLQIMGNGSKLL
jgi:putative nucleotidyltransferase with HDIG domain